MAQRICAWCGAQRTAQACLARRGLLVNVCRLCYSLEELSRLGVGVNEQTELFATLADGLETLYTFVRAEAEDAAQRNAAEGQSEGQGARQSRREGQGEGRSPSRRRPRRRSRSRSRCRR